MRGDPAIGQLDDEIAGVKELYAWLDEREITPGVTFFRLHVVNMAGDMDVEVGVLTDGPIEGDDRVLANVLPAGQFATLTGAGNGVRANRRLLEWIRARNLTMDCVEDPAGDRFGCRYEAYLTDPWKEPKKSTGGSNWPSGSRHNLSRTCRLTGTRTNKRPAP
jgi:hypothetical protein